ncbi:MAG: GNAT family N-acetyltransferase [Pseudomonadota bacterium]
MLAMATDRLKAFAPRLGHALRGTRSALRGTRDALRETRDRLTPGSLLLRRLIAAESVPGAFPAVADNDSGRLVAEVTTSRRDILAAQRLRYRVFTEEYGARFDGIAGIDRDRFDRYCRHLVVKDVLTGQVVGYTRILTDERARKAGGWYSAGEFSLDMVNGLEGRVLEIGRTCVHPDYRNGATIGVLWSKLAEILLDEGFTWLFGCASIPLADPAAPALLADMARRTETDPRFRVTPQVLLPAFAADAAVATAGKLPPLLRTYLAMGAKVCGAPCWDPDFHCADVFILVNVDTIPARYKRHFMAQRAARTELAA